MNGSRNRRSYEIERKPQLEGKKVMAVSAREPDTAVGQKFRLLNQKRTMSKVAKIVGLGIWSRVVSVVGGLRVLNEGVLGSTMRRDDVFDQERPHDQKHCE